MGYSRWGLVGGYNDFNTTSTHITSLASTDTVPPSVPHRVVQHHREVNFNWSGKQSLSTGVGLKTPWRKGRVYGGCGDCASRRGCRGIRAGDDWVGRRHLHSHSHVELEQRVSGFGLATDNFHLLVVTGLVPQVAKVSPPA